jgi:hypothetical protein
MSSQLEYIDNENFEYFAGMSYNNPIIDPEEFWEDVGRIKYVKRLFNKYRLTNELKTTLILNHFIVLYNVFEPYSLTKMLFFKFEGYHEYLKPFLLLLHRCPDSISPYTLAKPKIYITDIVDDENIVKSLRELTKHD